MIGLNGPRISAGASGFMSQVSSWLGAPRLKIMMTERSSCPLARRPLGLRGQQVGQSKTDRPERADLQKIAARDAVASLGRAAADQIEHGGILRFRAGRSRVGQLGSYRTTVVQAGIVQFAYVTTRWRQDQICRSERLARGAAGKRGHLRSGSHCRHADGNSDRHADRHSIRGAAECRDSRLHVWLELIVLQRPFVDGQCLSPIAGIFFQLAESGERSGVGRLQRQGFFQTGFSLVVLAEFLVEARNSIRGSGETGLRSVQRCIRAKASADRFSSTYSTARPRLQSQ